MEYLLLGPLIVRRSGEVLPVQRGKQRAMLAALLLQANRIVTVDELAAALWDDDQPPSVQVTLQNYVKRLRQALGDSDHSLISTQPHGYQIQAEPDEVDISRFRTLLTSAQSAARKGHWEASSELASDALALWRGDPLADVESDLLLRRDAPPLTEMRLQAQEHRIDAGLHLGHHAELIADLRQLTSGYPLRERFWVLLMLALYQSGRQADALAAYQHARHALIEQLGTEPGTELRSMQHLVLAGEDSAPPGLATVVTSTSGSVAPAATPPTSRTGAARTTRPAGPAHHTGPASPGRRPSTTPPARATPAARTTLPAGSPASTTLPADSAAPAGPAHGPAVPQQLPAPVRCFTGRSSELTQLTGYLERAARDTSGPLLISAIDGSAGVGKTALAVEGAHRAAGFFPDGQLYVNLRGYDPEHPMSAGTALSRFLRALGVPGQEIPHDDDERAARYRSLLAGRRMLIVLDNAGDVEQVRPLLPGCAGCAVVVTSRDSLAGLVARDGAQRIDLAALPMTEAVSLLRALIGTRVDSHATAAQALAERCCRLPLALRMAAEQAAARPATSLDDLAEELADQQQRLDLLDAGGDPETAVRAVFSWSYWHLDSAAARAFRLLGLHPGPDGDLYAVAALAGSPLRQARSTVDRLRSAHVVELGRRDRLHMHDLLHAYAAELADRYDSQVQQRAALTRMLDYYVHAAAVAVVTLFPDDPVSTPGLAGAPGADLPPVAGTSAARAWLDAELPVLVRCGALAASRHWPQHATALSAVLQPYLEASARFREGILIHGCARRAARVADDHAGEAAAMLRLSDLHRCQNRYEQAAGQLRQVLALGEETAGEQLTARARSDLAAVEAQLL